MLTFELTDDAEKLEVHGNREGLLKLAALLTNMAEAEQPDHAHLMTKNWGGSGLSSEVQGLQNTLLHHVKIFVWPQLKGEPADR